MQTFKLTKDVAFDLSARYNGYIGAMTTAEAAFKQAEGIAVTYNAALAEALKTVGITADLQKVQVDFQKARITVND